MRIALSVLTSLYYSILLLTVYLEERFAAFSFLFFAAYPSLPAPPHAPKNKRLQRPNAFLYTWVTWINTLVSCATSTFGLRRKR